MAKLITVLLFVAFGVLAVQSLMSGNFADAAMFGAIDLLIALFFVTVVRAGLYNQAFAAWFDRHRDAIAGGEAVELPSGVRVDEHTRIVRFEAVLSLLLVTWRVSSKIYVVGVEPTVGARITYSLFTLLFGWWGFPHGLWQTPLVIVQNVLATKSATLVEVATGLRPGMFTELEPREEDPDAPSPRVAWNQPADASASTSAATDA